jgi:tetratricopeptide (TPR) repeat protein
MMSGRLKAYSLACCPVLVWILAQFLPPDLAAQPIDTLRKTATSHAGQSYLEQGRKQLEQKRFALAIRSLSAAIRRDTNLAEAYRLRGQAYEQIGALQKAVQDFTKYIELRPSDPKGYIERADARNFNLDHQAAIEDYNRAIKLAKSSAAGHIGRGLAYAGLGKYDQAIKDYQQALRLNPDNKEVLANLGVACMLGGRSLEAMNYFERALKRETDPKWREQIEKWISQLLHDSRFSQTSGGPKRRGPTSSGKPMW